jgi:hypothetical protein
MRPRPDPENFPGQAYDVSSAGTSRGCVAAQHGPHICLAFGTRLAWAGPSTAAAKEAPKPTNKADAAQAAPAF